MPIVLGTITGVLIGTALGGFHWWFIPLAFIPACIGAWIADWIADR